MASRNQGKEREPRATGERVKGSHRAVVAEDEGRRGGSPAPGGSLGFLCRMIQRIACGFPGLVACYHRALLGKTPKNPGNADSSDARRLGTRRIVRQIDLTFVSNTRRTEKLR